MNDEIKLYDWLRENKMTITEFSKKIQCHRQIPQRIQCGKNVCLRIALATRILTNGKVNPAMKNVGRPKSYKHFHNVPKNEI